jgi:hypothetical protein
MQARAIAAAGLVLLALASLLLPASYGPAPLEPGAFSLRGRFIGPHAGEDAVAVACLCNEVADCIEWDGSQPEPMLTTGTSFAELRRRARELRLHRESIGNRQPHVRDAIKEYLDVAVGVNGGPVDDQQRANWVKAFREVGRAAADAVR